MHFNFFGIMPKGFRNRRDGFYWPTMRKLPEIMPERRHTTSGSTYEYPISNDATDAETALGEAERNPRGELPAGDAAGAA